MRPLLTFLVLAAAAASGGVGSGGVASGGAVVAAAGPPPARGTLVAAPRFVPEAGPLLAGDDRLAWLTRRDDAVLDLWVSEPGAGPRRVQRFVGSDTERLGAPRLSVSASAVGVDVFETRAGRVVRSRAYRGAFGEPLRLVASCSGARALVAPSDPATAATAPGAEARAAATARGAAVPAASARGAAASPGAAAPACVRGTLPPPAPPPKAAPAALRVGRDRELLRHVDVSDARAVWVARGCASAQIRTIALPPPAVVRAAIPACELRLRRPARLRGGRLRLAVSCAGFSIDCAARVTVRLHGRVIGRGTARYTHGTPPFAAASLRISAAGVRLLRGGRPARVLISARVGERGLLADAHLPGSVLRRTTRTIRARPGSGLSLRRPYGSARPPAARRSR
ncbi:MAG: hypothetical protein QOJ35_1324 [Solirubrobacteraceae bacterium]|jgi:hypothetical protein|nr:hypothetical protein [Solirubrobacteraceae bacterium]